MDKSKKYIEMSLASISYFGLKPPEPMDYIALETSVGSGEFRVMSGLEFWRSLCPNLDPLTMNRQWVKLLRQDQLQEMVNRSNHPFGLLFDLYEFVKKLPIKVTSMEQLWLAFVMKEKYNKTWNGKKWINGS